jgi:hypothetical protein
MKEKVFPNLSSYRPLQRRTTTTLCKWATALNQWEWPAEIARLTGQHAPGKQDEIRRWVMDEIFRELGIRVWRRYPGRL